VLRNDVDAAAEEEEEVGEDDDGDYGYPTKKITFPPGAVTAVTTMEPSQR
jgi:hypothetical protein